MLLERYLKNQLETVPGFLPATPSLPLMARLAKVDRLIVTTSEFFYTGEVVLNQVFTVQDQKEATRGEVLFLAGSLVGARTTDPLFRAIRRSAESLEIPLREMETDTLSVGGLVGKLDRTWYVLGTREAIQSEGIEIGVAGQTLAQQLEADGLLPLYLSQKGPKRLLAIFALLRKVDPEVSAALQILTEQGIGVSLLTSQASAVTTPLLRMLPEVNLVQLESPRQRSEVLERLAAEQEHALFLCTSKTASPLPLTALRLAVETGLPRWATVAVPSVGEIAPFLAAIRALLERLQKRFFWRRL